MTDEAAEPANCLERRKQCIRTAFPALSRAQRTHPNGQHPFSRTINGRVTLGSAFGAC